MADTSTEKSHAFVTDSTIDQDVEKPASIFVHLDSQTHGQAMVDASSLEKQPTTLAPPDASSQSSFPSPYQWRLSRKICIALIVSLGQLVTLMSASMTAPALLTIQKELHMGSTEVQVSFSIYQLGLALAPFLIGPASEVFGRKPLWVLCNCWFILWNAMCPVGKSKGMMIVARFLAGCGASAGTTLSGPILADMFTKENRGKSLALATLFPYLGPALGPIIGGIVSQHVSWPWLFYVLSIFAGGVVLLGILVIRESYTPVLLRRHQRKVAGLQRESLRNTCSELLSKLRKALGRPVQLLVRRPIIITLSSLMALEFGVYLLLLSIYATLFLTTYHQSETAASLHYIAIALGAWLAAQIGGQLLDLIFKHMKARSPDGESTPEFRIPLLAIGVVIVPIGLFWTGWSAQAKIHWIMADIGACIFTVGSFVTAQAVLAYLLDEFSENAASASAATRCLSYLFGFGFPLFAPQLYEGLGYGWGTSVLAFVWIVIAVPLTAMMWLWGAKVRAIGKREE